MAHDNDEIPMAVQQMLFLILFMVIAPIAVSWYADYGHWLRSLFPETQKVEQKK